MMYWSLKIRARALYHKGISVGQERKFIRTVPLQGISSPFASDPRACGRGVGGGFLRF